MKMGRRAETNLVGSLMEYVKSTKLGGHLLKDTVFIIYMDDALHFHLSNISEEYQEKFIDPDTEKYVDTFLDNLRPGFKYWGIRFHELEIEFKCVFYYYTKMERTMSLKIRLDDPEFRQYLIDNP